VKTLIREDFSRFNRPTRTIVLTKKQRNYFTIISLLIFDTLAVGAAFLLAYIIRFIWLPYGSLYTLNMYSSLVRIVIPIWLAIFAGFQLYNQHFLFGGLSEYSRVFNAVTFGTVVVIGLVFFMRDEDIISRGWLLISWFLAVIFMIGERFFIRRIIYYMRNQGHFLSPTLVVGANNEGRAIAEQFRNWGTSGLDIVGFIDESLSPGNRVDNNYYILGGLQDLDRIVIENEIEEIIIAPTSLTRDQLLCIFQDYSTSPDVKLRLSSGLFEILTTGLRIKEIAFVPLIELKEGRISGMEAFIKFLLDYSLTIPVLLITSPILLVIAIAIKIDSPGPVIFRRRVMGLNGIQFNAFKFRTMCLEANEMLDDRPDLQAELAENFKLKDDPRVTRIGAFLRKWSLDELPQMINVVFGQMSLVGPRMISPPEMEKYGDWGMNLLTVRPGITGMWQVSGRSDVSYEDRVRLDMYYIRNWTVWLDIFLLYKTPLAVIQKKGAY